ncbi:MAG: DinB family protein [Candidatus Thorarchaeota archaeon]|nr:DinB family protein [Candidatus Thorarchaeota archaeon]
MSQRVMGIKTLYPAMTDVARTTLKQGLIAFHIHSPPKKVLKDITPDIAVKRMNSSTHTIWELLNHLVFWQDITIDAVKEKEVNWSRSKIENWPEPIDSITHDELNALSMRFLAGIERMSALADEVDLSSGMPSWPEGTKHWAFQMIAQHNSYHLGQIVTIRQMMSDWPPMESPE